MRIDVDGVGFHVEMVQSKGLCFFPAGTRLEGVFTVDPVAEYAAAFLSPKFVARYGPTVGDRPLVGMAHGRIQLGLTELGRAARRSDSALEALVEGWALQSLAHLSRLGDPVVAEAGLSGEDLARVDGYVRAHLDEKLTVDQLARVAGFSRRHFLRAFKERTGQTPMRYVYARRLEEAQARLARMEESITDIAIACGFSHAQHLAAAFRRTTGMTPSQFRQQS
jgi:AraC family transcriptional regulator